MEKYGFIYIWYDKKRKMFYIGSHWGTEDDGYICSSNRMRDAHRRRPHDFRRRVVSKVYYREKLFEEEHKWLSLIPDDQLGLKYYNLRKHKWGHWTTDENSRKTVAQKLSEKNKGQGLGRTLSEETKKKIGASKKGNVYNVGRKHTEEARKNMKLASKLRPPTMLGKKQSEETKMKISLALKGKPKTKEHCEMLSIAHRKIKV